MKKLLLFPLLLIGKFCIAQNVGIGTSAPSAKLHVSNGAVLFSGTTGSTPVSGAGTRLMWIPAKAAFRAGEVAGSEWDDANIGISSTAIGNGTTASGDYSTAIGPGTYSTGIGATALGNSTHALGIWSTAIGRNSDATGYGSVVIGSLVYASGDFAFASGFQTKARSYSGFVAGLYNDTTDTPSPSTSNSQNRIFQIGNGTADNARTNAVTVLHNGNTGIGELYPDVNLVVNKDIRLDGQNANNGTVANSLRFGSSTTAEFIASKRTSGGNQYGLDFYTNGSNRLSITNGGTVQVANNLTVQNGKGLIRSTDGTQKKQLSASVTINTSFLAGETKTFAITWPETFSATPEAYVGNVTSGVGGWAELVMTVFGTSATGATLYVYNPKTVTANPNFTVKVIAIGAQ